MSPPSLPPVPRAFGSRAESVLKRFPQIEAVFCDAELAASAKAETADRRMAAPAFYTMILWDDPRALTAWNVAPAILSQFAQLDERRSTFDDLAAGSLNVNGVPIRDLGGLEPSTLTAVREFVELGGGQLFWSSRERERFAEVFERCTDRSEIVSAPHAIPSFIPGKPEKSRVIIWAPELSAEMTALLAFAFEEWRGSAYVVCQGGEAPNVRATYLRIGDPLLGDLLAGAALIVDASLSDPGAALAFAKHGIPLLTASTSGAHEFVRDAIVYEPAAWRTVCYGALRALGRPTELRPR